MKINPLRRPLLRTVVANPNDSPAAIVEASRFHCLRGLSLKCAAAYKYIPVKLSNENRLSAYGAERKIPAGEMIWKAAAKNENLSLRGENVAG